MNRNATLRTAALALLLAPLAAQAQQTIVVTNDVTSNTTWTAGNTYLLNGLIFVDNGATLTIEPGTVVKGRAAANITSGEFASALIIKRGAKIEANGTAAAPIIMTAENDDLNNPNDRLPTERGLWGGLIVLGSAPTNTGVTDNAVEGIPEANNAFYGGTNADDDSGTIRYVSIRHGGADLNDDDEINGLTLGGVGSGTEIEYVEVFANLDDGIEWFGGTVDVKYAVVAYSGDDSFDYAQGWDGNGQFWLVVQAPDDSDSAGEFDNLPENNAATPLTTPVVSNGTFIGPGQNPSGGGSRILRFREGAGGSFYNSVLAAGRSAAITFEGDVTKGLIGTENLTIRNNVIGTNFGAGATFAQLVTGASSEQTSALAALNSVRDAGIVVTTGDLDGDPANNEELISVVVSRFTTSELPEAAFDDIANLDDDFFTEVDYVGAINPDVATQFYTGWTFLDQVGVFTVQGGVDNEGGPLAEALALSVGPNPAAGDATVRFTLDRAQAVRVALYDVLGREVAVVADGTFGVGEQAATVSTGALPAGLYVLRLEAEGVTATRQLSVVR